MYTDKAKTKDNNKNNKLSDLLLLFELLKLL